MCCFLSLSAKWLWGDSAPHPCPQHTPLRAGRWDKILAAVPKACCGR